MTGTICAKTKTASMARLGYKASLRCLSADKKKKEKEMKRTKNIFEFGDGTKRIFNSSDGIIFRDSDGEGCIVFDEEFNDIYEALTQYKATKGFVKPRYEVCESTLCRKMYYIEDSKFGGTIHNSKDSLYLSKGDCQAICDVLNKSEVRCE